MQISEQDKQRLQHIATLIENGQLAEAKSLLTEFLHKSPNVAPAWYLVSFISSDTSKKQVALERALAIDPNYAPARNALTALRSTAAASSVPRSDASQPPPATKPSGNVPLPIALLVVVLVLVVVGGGVFLITKPGTVSDVKTFVATVRATPIGTPLMFSTTETRGEANVEMHAGKTDRQTGGRTDFTLRGLSSYRMTSDALFFAIEDERTSEYWEFLFHLPTYVDGRTYEDSLTINAGYVSGYYSADRFTRDTIRCPQIQSNYRIEKQNADFVITLSRTCNGDSQQWLDAVFRFKPNDSLTPTPTIPPEILFDFKPYPGTLRLEMNSSTGDPIGDGKGDIIFEATGELQRTGENNPYAHTFTASSATDQWKLSFWSPSFQLQQPYEVYQAVRHSNHGRLPEMNIEHPVRGYPVTYIGSCYAVRGNFTIEQQSPSIIISFEQHCNKDLSNVLRGRLIFTPDLTYATPTLTLTPTLSPLYTSIPPSDHVFPTWTPMPNSVSANGTPAASVNDTAADLASRSVVLDAEWLGRATRFETIRGIGNGSEGYSHNVFVISLMGSSYREHWVFTFQGERLLMGQTYQHVTFAEINATKVPRMSINKIGEGELCRNIDGSFRFDQQGSDIIVTFTQLCLDDDLMSIQGTLRLSPN